MSVAATAVTLLIGLPLAWLLSHRRFPGRDLLEALVVLPLILPPTVLGYYLLLLIGRQGPIGAALAAAGIELAFTWRAAVVAAAVEDDAATIGPQQPGQALEGKRLARA